MPRLFGAKLRHLRLTHELKQTDVAAHLGIGQAHLSHLEAGRKAPLLNLIRRVAVLFGVSTDYLLRDDVSVAEETGQVDVLAVLSSDYPTHLGVKLRTLREQHGLTQAQLADTLGLQQQGFVSFMEIRGKQPSPELLLRIADVFGISTDHLLWDD